MILLRSDGPGCDGTVEEDREATVSRDCWMDSARPICPGLQYATAIQCRAGSEKCALPGPRRGPVREGWLLSVWDEVLRTLVSCEGLAVRIPWSSALEPHGLPQIIMIARLLNFEIRVNYERGASMELNESS